MLNIFKICKKHKIKSVFQIFGIIVLTILLILQIAVYGVIGTSLGSCKPSACGPQGCAQAALRAFSCMSQLLALETALNGPINYENVDILEEIIMNRVSVSYRFFIKDTEDKKDKVLSEKEVKKYKLDNYDAHSVIGIHTGVSFIIRKFEKGCKNVDKENIENSSCLITVDLNGYNYEPNNDIFNEANPYKTDRYTVIIDGNNNKIIIPSKYYNLLKDFYG